ncbi:MAG: hypothetical protein ABMA64_00765 [Myxococcota bacterium]
MARQRCPRGICTLGRRLLGERGHYHRCAPQGLGGEGRVVDRVEDPRLLGVRPPRMEAEREQDESGDLVEGVARTGAERVVEPRHPVQRVDHRQGVAIRSQGEDLREVRREPRLAAQRRFGPALPQLALVGGERAASDAEERRL